MNALLCKTSIPQKGLKLNTEQHISSHGNHVAKTCNISIVTVTVLLFRHLGLMSLFSLDIKGAQWQTPL